MDQQDLLVQVLIHGRCERNCGRVADEKHTCPFNEEISGAPSECNCCEQCTRQCADDI